MKSLNSSLRGPLVSTVLAALTSVATATESPSTPVGTLDVNQLMVRTGVAPTVSWNIGYPTQVTDVIDIPPTDEIIPKTKLRVKVSMVGVGLTDQRGTQYPAKNYIKIGSSGWEHLFTGCGRDVRPGELLINRIIQPGHTLRFAAKVDLRNYRTYYNQDSNITILKNGDIPPNVAAGYQHQTPVASYLRPYIKDGKIALGPMDVLYVSELTHSKPSQSGYDMQDSIVLVQFEKVADE